MAALGTVQALRAVQALPLHPALGVVIAPAYLLGRVELARGHLEAGVGVEPGTEAVDLPCEYRVGA